MNLGDLRNIINYVDEQILELLNQRVQAASEIGKIKSVDDSEVYVPAREKDVLERVTALNKGPIQNDMLKAIYREIMSASISLEKEIRIAYLGPTATLSHQAALSRFGGSVQYKPCEKIGDVFTLVENRQADYGVVPIENTADGAVTSTLEQFFRTPLKICAEILLPISHFLLAKCPRDRIKRVYSNPRVLGQCRLWLHANMTGIEQVPVSSTAYAAERAANEQGAGALATLLAADLFDLNVLERDIQDLERNMARFLVVGKTFGQRTGQDKTSLVFSVKHEVGALFYVLKAFRDFGINLTRIESLPSREKAWEYSFYIDIEGHLENEVVKKALDEVMACCLNVRVLGSYPRADDGSLDGPEPG